MTYKTTRKSKENIIKTKTFSAINSVTSIMIRCVLFNNPISSIHSDSYQYSNIYVRINLEFSRKSKRHFARRLNIVLLYNFLSFPLCSLIVFRGSLQCALNIRFNQPQPICREEWLMNYKFFTSLHAAPYPSYFSTLIRWKSSQGPMQNHICMCVAQTRFAFSHRFLAKSRKFFMNSKLRTSTLIQQRFE